MYEISINGKVALQSPHKLIACDLETKGLEAKWDVVNYPILYESFTYQDVDGQLKSFGTSNIEAAFKLTRTLVEEGWCFIFHNNSFDRAVLAMYGIEIPLFHDTMIMSYVWYPESSEYHSLEALAPQVNEVKFARPNFSRYSDYLAKYGNQDSLITYKLFWHFYQLFQTDPRAWKFYLDIELPYSNIIREMELGCAIDIKAVDEFKDRLTQECHDLYGECIKIAGHWGYTEKKGKVLTPIDPDNFERGVVSYTKRNGICTYEHCVIDTFNPNSTEQLAKKLILLYGWQPKEWTEKGKAKMSKDVIEKLDYPLVRVYEKLNKKSTLVSNFLNKISEQAKDGYIRGGFNQCQTRTGRLSSSSMKNKEEKTEYGLNLQNIPAKGEGAELRKMFIARPGYKIVCGDLDRIEVVVLGFYMEMLVQDSYFANLVRNNHDVHDTNTVNWRTKMPKDQYIAQYGEKKWDEVRKTCKNGLFCLVYGGGETKLAKTAGITQQEAAEIIANIRATTQIFRLKSAIEQQCLGGAGVLNDWLGRRLVVPEILSSVKALQATGSRRINNYIIQGTAGSVFKYLQLKLKSVLRNNYPGFTDYRQILAVHDEAVYEVKEEYADWFAQVATAVYTDYQILSTGHTYVPVTATFHVADNWAEAKK